MGQFGIAMRQGKRMLVFVWTGPRCLSHDRETEENNKKMQNDRFQPPCPASPDGHPWADPLHGPGAIPLSPAPGCVAWRTITSTPLQTIAPTVLEHDRILEGRERLQQVLQIAGTK
jgi:hypothetical protein